MDSSRFLTRLDVVNTGIMDYLRQAHAGKYGEKLDRRYKLNVYHECNAKMNDERENSRSRLKVLDRSQPKRTRTLHAVGTRSAPSLSFCPLPMKEESFTFATTWVKSGPWILQP